MRTALVLGGLSGVGKTTVATEILSNHPEFELVRSATTRPRRNDGNEDEYIYLTREEFLDRVERGGMLEYTEFGGNLYGTPASECGRIFDSGRLPLLVLDLNGLKSMARLDLGFRAAIIYIYEELSVVSARLLAREKAAPSGKGMEAYERRMAMNRADYLCLPTLAPELSAFVRNTEVVSAAKECLAVYAHVARGGAPEVDKNIAIASVLADSARR